MSPVSVGHFVLFPCPDLPFSSSQARVICESPLCAAHIPYGLLKRTLGRNVSDTNNLFFTRWLCCVAWCFLPSLRISCFPVQILLSPGNMMLPFGPIFYFTHYGFFFTGFFFVDFRVFWAYLQLYFSKIGLEAIFWITESRSLLFQTAVPWNPFKILIEFQFDETVKSIKFSAPAFSMRRPFLCCLAWMVKNLLQISSLNLLMASFYHLSRCQRSPWASLALFPLYCFPFSSFSIFVDGN